MENAPLPDDLFIRTLGALITNINDSDQSYSGSSQELLDEQVCRTACSMLSAVSQCSHRCREAVVAGDLWQQAIRIVVWPMVAPGITKVHDHKYRKRVSQLRLLELAGTTTRRLYVDCIQLLPCDIADLVARCPNIATLVLRFYGPEGTFSLDWISAWCHTLKHLDIHFWYDGCLGPPQINAVLAPLLQSSEVLEDIYLRGIDWPKARMETYQALECSSARQQCSSLRRITLEGSECWSEMQLASLRSKGIVVRVSSMATDLTNSFDMY